MTSVQLFDNILFVNATDYVLSVITHDNMSRNNELTCGTDIWTFQCFELIPWSPLLVTQQITDLLCLPAIYNTVPFPQTYPDE